MDLNKEVGLRFRELRKALGRDYTLRRVSEEMTERHGDGWSFTFLGELERGDRKWKWEQIKQLSEYYNVPAPFITDPEIPIEAIPLIAEIVSELSTVSEEKLSAVLHLLRAS